MSQARRYNKTKLRYSLIPHEGLEELAKVYTYGAHKYTIYKDSAGNLIEGKDIPFEEAANLEVVDSGAQNWRKGQDWVDSMDSIKRHIQAWDKGEDIDTDLNTLHLANAAWGLMSLITYYKIYPQGDSRIHRALHMPNVGLDIDEVICDWINPWAKLYGHTTPTSWWFDRKITDRFNKMREEGTLDPFYLSLPPLITPMDIPFEPHCYVTSRPVSTEVTIDWLDKHGFPARPVYTVEPGQTKAEIIKEAGCDIFVDDSFTNFKQINQAGIPCYLMDRPHNHRYQVGKKRIYSLKDLV